MRMVVISDEGQKAELCGEGSGPADMLWVSSPEDVPAGAETIVDLLFVNSKERLMSLQNKGAASVLINSVTDTLQETDLSFVRINGWPTFLKGEWVECSGSQEKRSAAENFMSLFGKKAEWVADQSGFITPRVISMVINEAFFALGEDVSSKDDINTAMKLGTNYPYGPFEWAEKIGVERVHGLLSKLAETNSRYRPASNLTAKAP